MKKFLWASALVLSTLLGLNSNAQSPASEPRTQGQTEVLWLGQAAMRITTPGGKVIMIDPWLIPNPKTPAYPTTTIRLNRAEAGIPEEAQRFHPVSVHGESIAEAIEEERGNL